MIVEHRQWRECTFLLRTLRTLIIQEPCTLGLSLFAKCLYTIIQNHANLQLLLQALFKVWCNSFSCFWFSCRNFYINHMIIVNSRFVYYCAILYWFLFIVDLFTIALPCIGFCSMLICNFKILMATKGICMGSVIIIWMYGSWVKFSTKICLTI